MTQNTPNPPGGDDREPQGEGAPSFAKDADQGEYRNPYYGTRRGPDEPDLDADAPVLRSSDVQRLNRKALLFLAGIIALLAVMTFWLLNRAGNDEPEAPRQERPQSVVVPELPDQGVPPVQPGTDPNVPPLPVLPEDEGAQVAGGANSGAGAPQGPSLVERRIAGLEGSSGGGAGGGSAASGRAVRTEASSAQNLGNPDALLVRGTYLRCVLETRIITDVPGFTSCIVTEPIYSINGRSLLLPKGSKILGRYQQGADIARVAVIWDRIITPTGIDVTMQSPGVDGLGGAGHPGDYDGHWASKITSALLISLISDAFSWAAAEHGPESTATIVGSGGVTVVEQPFESATARSMERLANQALQRSAARPGTVTINQGTVVNVYVAQDVDFSSVLSLQ
jgi:type IV secretion system protein VirB10